MPKCIMTAVESVKEGKTLADVRAAWEHVAAMAAETEGMQSFQSSWNEESKTCLVTEVFDGPANYLAFLGKVDMALVSQAIQFESLTLQCASDQVAGFGDVIANFGIKVYLTDGCAGNL